MKKIVVFYHAWLCNNWKELMAEQLATLYNSGLYGACESLNIGVVGVEEQVDVFKQMLKNEFVNYASKINFRVTNKNTFEYITINWIKEYCETNEDCYVLYFHTKGISVPIYTFEKEAREDWRKCMEFWNIMKWKDCVKKLDEGFDAVGICHTVRAFFLGNFWWASSDYIKKLPRLSPPTNRDYPKNMIKRKRGEDKICKNMANRVFFEQWLLNIGDYSPKVFNAYYTNAFYKDRSHPKNIYEHLDFPQTTQTLIGHLRSSRR